MAISDEEREALQKDFYSFFLYINEEAQGSDFVTGKWEEELCDFFQYEAYYRYLKGKRVVATCEEPVQHGKSTKLRIFTAWLIGHHRNRRFNFYTAAENLLNETQSEILRILSSARYIEVFGHVVKKSVDGQIFFNQARGDINFRLMGGGNTGYPSHFSIIDDPYRNSDDAYSETVREKIFNRFRGDIMSRRQNATMVIVLHSRWCEGDLIDVIKKSDAYKNILISSNHPAINENGDALFPELRNIEFLKEQELLLGQRAFSALYQQNPVIAGGNLIKDADFKRVAIIPERFEHVYIVGDTAFSEKTSSDRSVFGLFGIKDGEIYIIDMIYGHWGFVDLKQNLKDFYFSWKENLKFNSLNSVYVEKKASGISLIQQLQYEKIPIMEVMPQLKSGKVADKYQRYLEIEAILKSHLVNIPAEASWIFDFLKECMAFTSNNTHLHDDMVDILSYGLQLSGKYGIGGIKKKIDWQAVAARRGV